MLSHVLLFSVDLKLILTNLLALLEAEDLKTLSYMNKLRLMGMKRLAQNYPTQSVPQYLSFCQCSFQDSIPRMFSVFKSHGILVVLPGNKL